jgi:hypothetical protein
LAVAFFALHVSETPARGWVVAKRGKLAVSWWYKVTAHVLPLQKGLVERVSNCLQWVRDFSADIHDI